MKHTEIEWELRLFKLLAICIIAFSLLVLRCALGLGGTEALFMRGEIPSMCLSLASSLIVLSSELALWYIFRVKGKDASILVSKKR